MARVSIFETGKNNVAVWALLAVALAIFGTMLFGQNVQRPSTETDLPANAAALTIVFRNGQEPRKFAGEAVDGMMIVDALQAASYEGNFVATFDESGALVRLGDVRGSWQALRNNVPVNRPLTVEPIAPGDDILLVPKIVDLIVPNDTQS